MSGLDMALGDIIKASKPSGSNKRGGKGGRGRGGGRPANRGRNSGGNYGPSRGNQQRRQQRQQQSAPYNPPVQQGPRLGAGTKVLVSNLDPDVIAEDVEEIFERIGAVKDAVIFYDRDGNSMGTAEVTFHKSSHAVQAVDDYDGAKVDGRPMYLKLIANRIEQRAVQPRAAPQRQQPRQQQRQAPRGRSRGGGASRRGAKSGKGGGKPQNKGPAPTAESLDAEMDAYFQKKDSAPAAAKAAEPAAAGQPA